MSVGDGAGADQFDTIETGSQIVDAAHVFGKLACILGLKKFANAAFSEVEAVIVIRVIALHILHHKIAGILTLLRLSASFYVNI